MKELKLSNSESFCLLDDEDYERFKKHVWRLLGAGYVSRGTALKNGKQKTLYIHRLILNAKDNERIDHINRNKLDNRKENLRFCSHVQNHQNISKFKGNWTSRYKGVHWDKRRKSWRARIKVNGKEIYLGRFINEIDAAKAYNRASIKYHKKFACLNEIYNSDIVRTCSLQK